jgi:hypothetical protein
MPRLLQNPDDLRQPAAVCLQIQPCANCGNSMLASGRSPVNDRNQPICVSCAVEQTVRKLRSG